MEREKIIEELNSLIAQVNDAEPRYGSVVLNQAVLVDRLWMIRALVADGEI